MIKTLFIDKPTVWDKDEKVRDTIIWGKVLTLTKELHTDYLYEFDENGRLRWCAYSIQATARVKRFLKKKGLKGDFSIINKRKVTYTAGTLTYTSNIKGKEKK